MEDNFENNFLQVIIAIIAPLYINSDRATRDQFDVFRGKIYSLLQTYILIIMYKCSQQSLHFLASNRRCWET